MLSRKFVVIIFIKIFGSGAIPKHVGIILDGNRRFAKKKKIESFEGHQFGTEKFAEVHSWCRSLGIKEVTAFILSTENLKRNSEEVSYLFDLLALKLESILNDEANVKKIGIQINFIGNFDLLPSKVKILASKVTLMTQNNSNFVLNLAVAYTARGEIAHSINKIRKAVLNNQIDASDINCDLLEKCLYTKNSNLDMIIRTSGEHRLSDFLLWQVSEKLFFNNFTLYNRFSTE